LRGWRISFIYSHDLGINRWEWGQKVRNQVVSCLVWLWWVIDLARFEFESGIVLFCFSFTRSENRVWSPNLDTKQRQGEVKPWANRLDRKRSRAGVHRWINDIGGCSILGSGGGERGRREPAHSDEKRAFIVVRPWWGRLGATRPTLTGEMTPPCVDAVVSLSGGPGHAERERAWHRQVGLTQLDLKFWILLPGWNL
jgi:hypothetical protein